MIYKLIPCAMELFELVPLQNGVTSLRSLHNRETFHPGIGPQAEARILHIEQQKIVERARVNPDFVMWDIGLGAAANAISAIQALESGLGENHPHSVTLQSFDQTTAPLEFALKNAKALGYLVGYEKAIHQLLNSGSVRLKNGLQWHFHLGDFCTDVKSLSLRSPDAIFYDPYSVKCNTAMWTLQHFTALFNRLDPERATLMTSYTNSTYVRVTLLLAGFYVGMGCAVDRKLHTSIASTQLHQLECPLDRDWLYRRVRISHSAAAIRDLPYQIAHISEEDFEQLKKHPQFN